ERGPRALLLGPALLLREVARDLPPELGSVLAAALEPRRTLVLRHARGVLDLARPAVMGIVNVTPDSFSDAGEAFAAAAAIDRARRMVAAGARAIVMHMRGTPETMQADPRYDDLLGEVAGWLAERAAAAEAAGVAPDAIALDPGFGFGKTPDHNLELLRRLDELRSLGRPVA